MAYDIMFDVGISTVLEDIIHCILYLSIEDNTILHKESIRIMDARRKGKGIDEVFLALDQDAVQLDEFTVAYFPRNGT